MLEMHKHSIFFLLTVLTLEVTNHHPPQNFTITNHWLKQRSKDGRLWIKAKNSSRASKLNIHL